MIRGQNFVGRDRAELLRQQRVHLESLALRTHLIGFAARAVVGVTVAPVIETGAVRVRRIGRMRSDRKRPRVESVHARRPDVQVLFPRRFMVVHEKNPALPIDPAVGSVDQIVRGMVRIRSAQTLQQRIADVGLVIPVGVLQEQQIRSRSDDHTAAPKFESERVVDVGKDFSHIRPTVAVRVLQDHQTVVHFLAGFPFGIGVPARGPQASFRIDLHLHGIGKVGELFLGRKNVQLVALGDVDLGTGFFRAQVFDVALFLGVGTFASSAHVGDDFDRRWDVTVVDKVLLSFHRGPDRFVTIRRHHIQHHQFMLQHVGIALSVDKGQRRPAAPNVISVGRVIAIVPMPVLVFDRCIQFG